MPASAAAATLFLAMVVATVGTIFQAGPGSACGPEPCPAEYRTAGAVSSASWEASLESALRQTERGLQQRVGIPAPR